MTKRIRVIAGPNGSGKTTFFHELEKMVHVYDFINADDIKALLEKKGRFILPFDIESGEMDRTIASSSFDSTVKKLLSDRLIHCIGRKVEFSREAINSYSVAAFADFLRNAYMEREMSFTMETVFSHPSKLDFLSHANELGYKLYLYFVATDSPELNVKRVGQRVAAGGHDVPREKIIERYYRCLENFYPSLQFAYRAFFLDNSTEQMNLFAELNPDHNMKIVKKTPHWFDDCILEKISSSTTIEI